MLTPLCFGPGEEHWQLTHMHSGQTVSGHLRHDFCCGEGRALLWSMDFIWRNDMKRPVGISLINCTVFYLR